MRLHTYQSHGISQSHLKVLLSPTAYASAHRMIIGLSILVNPFVLIPYRLNQNQWACREINLEILL